MDKSATEEQLSDRGIAMTQQQARPAQLRRQARLMQAINLPMRFLLRLPFPTPLSSQLMLLSLTGRKTGKHYLQPVSYVRDGDTLLTPGGGKWRLNLSEDRPIQIYLRGHKVQARPELVKDADEVERLLRYMMTVNPRVTSFVPVSGPDGQIDHTKVETAVRYGFRLIRWHLPGTANQ